MEELRNNAYENARIYKERTKRWHDKHIMLRDFKNGQKVLLFNSCLPSISGKVTFEMIGSFEVTQVLPHEAIKIHSPTKGMFKVNSQQLKPYM